MCFAGYISNGCWHVTVIVIIYNSYVSLNMDSVNNYELFSLLHPDIYRSFFDDGVYESTAPLLELPISPSTNFLAEISSSPQSQNDP